MVSLPFGGLERRCFKPFQAAQIDISGLARAAVAGDEQALDLFTSG